MYENQLPLEQEIGVYFNLGMEYYDKKDYDQAIGYFSQAIRLKPNEAIFYYLRNFAYFNKGNVDQAIVDLEIAVNLDPENNDYRKTLAAAKSEMSIHSNKLELISLLMSVINGPVYNLTAALNDIPVRLVRTIQAIADQKNGGEKNGC